MSLYLALLLIIVVGTFVAFWFKYVPVEIFMLICVLRPEDAEGWVELAEMLVRKERYEEAGEAASNAIKVNPNLYKAWIVLSAVHESLGDRKKADEALSMAIDCEMPLDTDDNIDMSL